MYPKLIFDDPEIAKSVGALEKDLEDALAQKKKNSEHTPGPWKWDGDRLVSATATNTDWDEVRPVVIIETDGGFYPPFGADRDLLAAAPELLAALEYMVNVCPAINSQGEEAHQKARAEIAKAKGETK